MSYLIYLQAKTNKCGGFDVSSKRYHTQDLYTYNNHRIELRHTCVVRERGMKI